MNKIKWRIQYEEEMNEGENGLKRNISKEKMKEIKCWKIDRNKLKWKIAKKENGTPLWITTKEEYNEKKNEWRKEKLKIKHFVREEWKKLNRKLKAIERDWKCNKIKKRERKISKWEKWYNCKNPFF